jgi:hypothetical protein
MIDMQGAAIRHLCPAPPDPHLHVALLHVQSGSSTQQDSPTPVRCHHLLSWASTTPTHCALGQLGLTTECLHRITSNGILV